MKQISYLYLLAADHDFRLIRTHDTGLAEILDGKGDTMTRGPHHTGDLGRLDDQRHADFAKAAAAALAAEWAKGGHERIVIAAGPKMLGLIREALPKPLLRHVAAELHKDLVKIPLHDLPSHFSDVPVV
jgi:hypothetical protein